jgi:hypothetical protein
LNPPPKEDIGERPVFAIFAHLEFTFYDAKTLLVLGTKKDLSSVSLTFGF